MFQIIYYVFFTFAFILALYVANTWPLFFATKKWALLRAKKYNASPFYDYTSHKVHTTLALLGGVLFGLLFFISATLFYLYENHPCELDEIYSLFPIAAIHLKNFRFFITPLVWVLPLLLAVKMFYLHHRQKTLENNIPNSGFRLIGMAACACTTGYWVVWLQNATQSGGGCHGL